MKNQIVYFIIIFALSASLVVVAKSCVDTRAKRLISENNIVSLSSMYESYRDKYNRSAMKVQALELSANNLKSMVNSKDDVIRTLSREVQLLRAKMKSVETAVYINSNTSGSVTMNEIDTVIHDTILSVMHYAEFKDPWMSISLFKRDDSDSLDVIYSVDNPIVAVVYKDRPLKLDGSKYPIPIRWFKGWTYYLEAKCLNPNSTITSAGAVKIMKRD